MKKLFTLIMSILCFCIINAQNNFPIVYSAIPKSGSPSTFFESVNSNVTITSSIGFTTNFTSSTCTSLPGRTVTESATTYNDSYERAQGKYLSFKITPKAGYKIVLSSISFKISASNTNIKIKPWFSNNRVADDNYSSIDYAPSAHTCGANDTAAMTLQAFTPDLKTSGNNNIIDSVNGILVRFFFFNAPTATQINIINVQLNGCVVADASLTDCLGNPLVMGSALKVSKYSSIPTFSDEFNTSGFNGNTYNRKDWKPRTGGSFGGICTGANDTIYNGALHIRYTDTIRANGTGGFDTSYYGGGLISTHNLRYGYYEIKAKLYGGTKGFHQSFWCTGNGSTTTSIVNDSTPRGAEMSENQCFEFDSDTSQTGAYCPLQPSIWLPGSPNYSAFYSKVATVRPTVDTNIIGFEYLPDSFNIYINNKLVSAYAMTDTVMKYSIAESWMLSALPTPVGYYSTPLPLPKSGGEMWVDYFRFYAPVDPAGINFIGNSIFGSQCNLPITPATQHKPSGWVNALKYDINQNLLSTVYDTIATTIVSDDFVQDPNNSTSLKHYKASAYRTSTRQVLEGIPNGGYQFSVYVKSSNLSSDSVFVRIKTRNTTNTADTIYSQRVNLTNNTADVIWRKVSFSGIYVNNNSAIVELYSKAAAGSYTYFDSAVLIGLPKAVITYNDTVVNRYIGSSDFNLPITSSSSESPLIITLSDTSLASITGTSLHLKAQGTLTIKVSQAASTNFNAADSVTKSYNIWISSPFNPNVIHGGNVIDTVESENFDIGNKEYAFHEYDTSTNTLYRNGDIDIANCTDTGSGYKVQKTGLGEWVKYTVNVLSAGSYIVKSRCTAGANGNLRIDVDGVTGNTKLAPSSNWVTWSNVLDTINLTSGIHVLKVNTPNGSIHLNRFVFSRYSALPLSTTLQLHTEVENRVDNKLVIYPNPTKGNNFAKIKLATSVSGNADVELVNTNGKIVFSKRVSTLPLGESYLTLPLSNLAKGIYIVRLKINQQINTSKLIVD